MKSRVMWRITSDHLESKLRLAESQNWNDKHSESMRQFRMFDDDNVLCYEGEGNCLEHIDGTGFEPLDDYGTPNAGCTFIEWNVSLDIDGDPKWERL